MAAGVVLLHPASPGPVLLPVVRCGPCSGAQAFTTCLSKSLGSSNAINIVHATVKA